MCTGLEWWLAECLPCPASQAAASGLSEECIGGALLAAEVAVPLDMHVWGPSESGCVWDELFAMAEVESNAVVGLEQRNQTVSAYLRGRRKAAARHRM